MAGGQTTLSRLAGLGCRGRKRASSERGQRNGRERKRSLTDNCDSLHSIFLFSLSFSFSFSFVAIRRQRLGISSLPLLSATNTTHLAQAERTR